MGAEDFTYTTFPMQENPSVLKVAIPKDYNEKDASKLHELVKNRLATYILWLLYQKM